VVFGELKEGKGIIRKIESMPTQADKPSKEVTIVGMLGASRPRSFLLSP